MDHEVSENRLRFEKSPYLLQHKENPVWWQPWDERALEFARETNRPIFLSIGYSTCHWCHVMEHESFEDQEVADFLNQNFVSIKVDREERPDLDHIYMKAIHLMGQRGGWPLSVALTPSLDPFWGGTYFPKDHFLHILRVIVQRWGESHEEISQKSGEIEKYLKMAAPLSFGDPSVIHARGEEVLDRLYEDLHESFDADFGGFNDAPKFPPTMALRFLLRAEINASEEMKRLEVRKLLDQTLHSMFRGGLFDHLGGGFARYSTDRRWLIPHFEKMLYDNANLSLVYLEAFSATKEPLYAEIARFTLSYVLDEMTDVHGGFYSAEDADSEGQEGLYYLWTQQELRKHLTQDEFDMVQRVYGVTEHGNFEEGKNHLNLLQCEDANVVFDPKFVSIREKLLTLRRTRVRPHLDDKILVCWNGLMISAFAKGFQILREERFLKAAQRGAIFLRERLDHGSRELLRRYRDGEPKISAFLDDYAYLIQGLLDLYESDFDGRWISWAVDLQRRQDERLWSTSHRAYFYAENSEDRLCQTIEFGDSAEPNANGVSTLNLLRLYSLTYNEENFRRAKDLLLHFVEQLQRHPIGYIQGAIALDFHLHHPKGVALVCNRTSQSEEVLETLQTQFLPYKTVAVSWEQEEIAEELQILKGKRPSAKVPFVAYICEDGACGAPESDPAKFKLEVPSTW